MSTSPATAYLLVSHGSRDPRHQSATNRVAQLVRQQLYQRAVTAAAIAAQPTPQPAPRSTTSPPSARRRLVGDRSRYHQRRIQPLVTSPPITVGTAVLERGPLPLHQQIIEFYTRIQAMGITQLVVVPLFLLAGVHVCEDLPGEIQVAQTHLGDSAQIQLRPYLGSHPGLGELLQQRVKAAEVEAWVLLAHGSRRPGGNRPLEYLAKDLGGSLAFWAVEPHLEEQVIHQLQQGYERLAIVPFFLFAGTTTDAIAHRTEELAERFPQAQLRLLAPLGTSAAVANLVCDLALDTGEAAAATPTFSRRYGLKPLLSAVGGLAVQQLL